jgi:hypothetical protein
MFNKLKKTFVFNRESSIYTFSKNPLEVKLDVGHIFMPWKDEVDEELMFKIKEEILTRGNTYIPLLEFNFDKFILSDEQTGMLDHQLANQIETHLVLTNFESIHVCRIKRIINKEMMLNLPGCEIDCLKKISSKGEFWIEVDDLYVLDVNHIGISKDIFNEINSFISNKQTHNIFQTFKSFRVGSLNETFFEIQQNRWVDLNRSLTYDYYIRACELKDNIYQDSWTYLSRRTHHELISSALDRHKGVLFRDLKKWNLLYTSFSSYKKAIITELNNVYIRPLANAIVDSDILKEAWEGIQGGVINPKINGMIKSLIEGDITEVDSLTDFLFYIKNVRSFLFTLKNKFTKKIYKEEFLTIENFLIRQESLIESLTFRGLDKKIKSIIDIDDWINETNNNISESSKDMVKDCNLKLSHLLSIMASASYADNIFFKLIEEKAGRGIVQKSFEDEVKDLLSIELKKAA